jgi:peptidoglycan/LPS O-acetylase OafA/YrhL
MTSAFVVARPDGIALGARHRRPTIRRRVPTPLDHERFRATRTFASLDGLRALAILAVLWHHAPVPVPLRAAERGFLGVDLFFVLSGFLIVTLLRRERARTGGVALGAFWMRRVLRIVPVHYAVLLVYVAGTAWSSSPAALAVRHDLPFAFTYTSNWVPMQSPLSITWSLSAEEQFYLLWPLLEAFAAAVAGRVLGLAIVAFASAQLLAAHAGWFAGAPTFLRETSFTPILLGVALAHLLDTRAAWQRLAPWLGHAAAPWLALGSVVAICQCAPPDLGGAARLGVHVALAALVGACVVREDHGLAALLRWPPLARLGVVSYGVYLLHMPVMHFVDKGMARVGVDTAPLRFVAVLALAWLAAELSFRWFESPLLALKKRWQR